MQEFWELCNLESRAVLGCLFKQEQGHWPDWDDRSGKVRKAKRVIYEHDLEPEPDPELVRDMAKAPHSPRHVE